MKEGTRILTIITERQKAGETCTLQQGQARSHESAAADLHGFIHLWAAPKLIHFLRARRIKDPTTDDCWLTFECLEHGGGQ